MSGFAPVSKGVKEYLGYGALRMMSEENIAKTIAIGGAGMIAGGIIGHQDGHTVGGAFVGDLATAGGLLLYNASKASVLR